MISKFEKVVYTLTIITCLAVIGLTVGDCDGARNQDACKPDTTLASWYDPRTRQARAVCVDKDGKEYVK